MADLRRGRKAHRSEVAHGQQIILKGTLYTEDQQQNVPVGKGHQPHVGVLARSDMQVPDVAHGTLRLAFSRCDMCTSNIVLTHDFDRFNSDQ